MYNPSTPIQFIEDEQRVLGIKFPNGLIDFLKIINGIEYKDKWYFYSVLNPVNRKVKYAYFRTRNIDSGWEYRDKDLFEIASDDCGNCLVLKVVDCVAGNEIFEWDHETNRSKLSKITFDIIINYAIKHIGKINNKIKNRAQQGDAPETSAI